MAYTKQTWTDLAGTGLNKYTFNGVRSTMVWDPDSITAAGTAVTASRMNHIENGLESAASVADTANTTANNAVPNTRTVNGKRLNADITLAASDVSAVPTTTKVNGHALSGDVTVTKSDVGLSVVNNQGITFSLNSAHTVLTIAVTNP